MVIQINVRNIHRKGQLPHKLQLSQDPPTPHLSAMQIYSSEGKLSSWSTKDTWAKSRKRWGKEGGGLQPDWLKPIFNVCLLGLTRSLWSPVSSNARPDKLNIHHRYFPLFCVFLCLRLVIFPPSKEYFSEPFVKLDTVLPMCVCWQDIWGRKEEKEGRK